MTNAGFFNEKHKTCKKLENVFRLSNWENVKKISSFSARQCDREKFERKEEIKYNRYANSQINCIYHFVKVSFQIAAL